MKSPVVLFVYNRPWHTRQTLEALANNYLADQSELYIYADGPKENSSEIEIESIKKVRKIIREKQWCKLVHIIESESNHGLAASIIRGVSEVNNKHKKVIVLEDDILTSPWFLSYMNEALDVYQHVSNVFSVSGYMFPIQTSKRGIVLLPFTSIWGWGTWKERWEAFDWNLNQKEYIENNAFLKTRFNLADYNYTEMLKNANSWAIRWYYSVFVRNGLTVFPTISLVKNIGFDGSGIHCPSNEIFLSQGIEMNKIEVEKVDRIDLEFYAKILDFFTEEKKRSLKKDIKKIFYYILRK